MKIKIKVCISILLLLMIGYNIYNNSKINVLKEDIVIEDIPKSFENFTILQISDLHGKRFGKNQKRLIQKINNLDYDIIAMTGDMQDSKNNDDKPLNELLDGIKNKDYLFYVSGNHGPKYSNELKDKGCISLDKPYEIKRGNDSIWMYDFYSDTKLKPEGKEIDDRYTKIAITHYPWNETFYDNAKDQVGSYDLVIAGHYHGGQYRIPFYGAIFIPEVNTGDCYFPKQDDVSGLNIYGNYKQYISAGLGASGSKIRRFRLFNTPEINLIRLVKN